MNTKRNGFHFKKLSKEAAADAVAMYERGLSIAPIAAFYGVSRQAMWDLLRRRTTLRSGRRVGSDNALFRGGRVANDKAQNMAEYAIRTGVLVRPKTCSECGGSGPEYKDGRSAIQAHHDDYTRPLVVRCLCQPCHLKWHLNNTPITERDP